MESAGDKTDDARRAVLDSLGAVDEAEVRLREQLQHYRELREITRRHLEDGGTARSLRALIDLIDARTRNDDALRALGEARVDSQFSLYRMAAAEGMSAAEIGRTWGVSRQFVSRVLNGSRPARREVGRPVSRVGSRDQPGPP